MRKLEDQGINKIIALGHAGYSVDKDIAAIKGVDIVVGGHSHTLLYSGKVTTTKGSGCLDHFYQNRSVDPVLGLKAPVSKYRKTSNIRRTLGGNKIVDHSDVVGAAPVGAAPTTSSFSTWHLPSRDSAKTAARQYDNLLSVEIWCGLH